MSFSTDLNSHYYLFIVIRPHGCNSCRSSSVLRTSDDRFSKFARTLAPVEQDNGHMQALALASQTRASPAVTENSAT
jgi:hypothetical protein